MPRDDDSLPDVDVKIGEKQVKISISPIEWIIVSFTVIICILLLR